MSGPLNGRSFARKQVEIGLFIATKGWIYDDIELSDLVGEALG